MKTAKLLLIGALALMAFSAVTAVVVALAPYIAVFGIVTCVCAYIWAQTKDDS